MPELGGVTINVGINISEEIVNRCCEILQMYLADNPDKIVMSQQAKYPGEYPMVWIGTKETESEDD